MRAEFEMFSMQVIFLIAQKLPFPDVGSFQLLQADTRRQGDQWLVQSLCRGVWVVEIWIERLVLNIIFSAW